MKDFENCLKVTLTFFGLFKTAILHCLHFVGALKQGDLWLPICINLDFIWSNMLDFSQTFNNPRVTLKTYPRNWSVCLMSTHTDLPYLVSAPWILRDFTPCKERENGCTGFRSTLSPLFGKVFGGRVLCCIHLCKPRSWCGARHTEGTEVSRVFSPAGGVRGPRIPPASTRIRSEWGLGWQSTFKGQITASSHKGTWVVEMNLEGGWRYLRNGQVVGKTYSLPKWRSWRTALI